MKRFLARSGLFVIPLLVGAVWLLWSPLDKGFAYDYLGRSCGDRAGWIHDRILPGSNPVDVVFVGSSRLLGAVDPRRLETTFRAVAGRDLVAKNLGYCQPGRNLHYVLLKELLGRKPVRHVVVGAPIRESRQSHWAFGYLAESEDLLTAFPSRYLVRDLLTGVASRFESVRQPLLFRDRVSRQPKPGEVLPQRAGDLATLTRVKESRQRRASQKWRKRLRKTLFASHYVAGIARLAHDHGARLHFLYLPGYGEPWGEMESLELYESLGDVLMPPASLFLDPDNWLDDNHLDREAAAELTDWLVPRMAEWD